MKFLAELAEGELKDQIKETARKLADYPLSLRELDVEKLKGAEKTFKARIGRYRVLFQVDKTERTIFVTHLGKRESIYES